MEQNNEDKYTPEEIMLEKSTIYIFIITLQKNITTLRASIIFVVNVLVTFPYH